MIWFCRTIIRNKRTSLSSLAYILNFTKNKSEVLQYACQNIRILKSVSNRFEVFLKFCKWCRGIEFALLNPKEQSLPAPNSLCFYVWHGPQFRQNEMGSCRVRRCHVTIREEVWKYGENYPKYFLSKEATKTSLLDWTTCPQFFSWAINCEIITSLLLNLIEIESPGVFFNCILDLMNNLCAIFWLRLYNFDMGL